MKRQQLFEFEDQSWFPGWLRTCMTRCINVMHRLIKSEDQITKLIAPVMRSTGIHNIIDLCSGSGGPMPGVYEQLRKEFPQTTLTMTDLYPESDLKLNDDSGSIRYLNKPVDATNPPADLRGIRSMICSFHHMTPEAATKILASAQKDKQPIVIYEMSDNSFPKWLWWIAFPVNVITCVFITFLVRPVTITQLLFTYIIPIIPIFFAWDGAVSNARTYTLQDMAELLESLPNDEKYAWEMDTIPGKAKKLYLKGLPVD